MRIKLTKKQREIYGEKWVELANWGLIGLVLGQFVTERVFSLLLAVVGISVFVICYLISHFVLKG